MHYITIENEQITSIRVQEVQVKVFGIRYFTEA
jgi:hypothetical protein